MTIRKLGLLLGVVVVIAVVVSSAASAASSTATVQPQVISDASLTAQTATIGGATALSTTRTVAHWFGSTLDPNNGVTYGYNMVGADPVQLLRLGLRRDRGDRHHPAQCRS